MPIKEIWSGWGYLLKGKRRAVDPDGVWNAINIFAKINREKRIFRIWKDGKRGNSLRATLEAM